MLTIVFSNSFKKFNFSLSLQEYEGSPTLYHKNLHTYNEMSLLRKGNIESKLDNQERSRPSCLLIRNLSKQPLNKTIIPIQKNNINHTYVKFNIYLENVFQWKRVY